MFTYLDLGKWSKKFRRIPESSLFSLDFETNVDTLGAVIQKWEILNSFLPVCCMFTCKLTFDKIIAFF